MKKTKVDELAQKLPLLVTSRATFAVSSISLWSDEVWRLDTNTPGQRYSIGWKFQLPDGTCSTDQCNAMLLECFKVVIWGMLSHGGTYGKSLKPGSAISMGVGMRELFRWMVHFSYSCFAELDAAAQADFLLDLPIILANRRKFYGSSAADVNDADDAPLVTEVSSMSDFDVPDDADDADDEGTISYSQAIYRINTFYHIFYQKKALLSRGLPALLTSPFDGKLVGSVTSKIAKYVVNRIPPLPDEVALPLLKEALSWVDFKAKDILHLQSEFVTCRNDAISAGLSNSGATNRINKMLQSFEFSTAEGNEFPWREPLTELERVCHPAKGDMVYDSTQNLRNLVMRARDASVIALQYMVGLRASEICSAKGGWDVGNDLPDCVVRSYSKNGIVEMFFLKGVLSKGVPHPRDDEWLLGCRPVGSSYFPVPVRALMLLERLYRPWRELGGNGDLIVNFAQKKGLPVAAKSVSKITSGALLRGTKRFIFTEVDLSHLPDTNIHDEDLETYRDTKGLCIKTHQGRKTFAAYVLESKTSLLRPVSEHFKHISVAVTESAYFPAVSRLRGDAESMRFAQSVAFFVEAAQGKKVYGRMGEIVERYFGDKEWRENMSLRELENKVTELVQVHDLRIFFSSHGNCLIKANPLNSRCRAATDTVSWDATTPDFSARSPGLCAGCGCFAMDSAHRPFWENRVHKMTLVVNAANTEQQSREFRVHQLRLEQAINVLKIFDNESARTQSEEILPEVSL
jgi:integrase